jgi:hypothetical protein
MPPRVLLLARENVLNWTPLYVAAFRRHAEVLAVGPALDRAALASVGLGHAADFLEPNDFCTDSDDAEAIVNALPAGWRPDLVVAVQSGAPRYRNLARLDVPTAYLSIDTWHDPEELATARPYDQVFVAQRAFLPWLREAGNRHVHWLPLAAEPRRHFPVDTAEAHDLVFVGSTRFVVNEQRIVRMNQLATAYSMATLVQGVDAESMSAGYALGRIAFNSSVAQDVNMRIFETLAMGRCLLTNRDAEANGLFDLFKEGVHLRTYSDDDLMAQVRRLLDDPVRRAAMGQAGREEVLARHTYDHRAVEVLAQLAESARPHARRLAPGPSHDLAAWLPRGTMRVADIGLGLAASHRAWRHRDVASSVGIGFARVDLVAHAAHYDSMLAWPAPPSPFDTVLIHVGHAYGPDCDAGLAWAGQALDAGGTLILHGLPPGVALADTLAAAGFAAVHSEPALGVWIARRCARPLHEIAADIYVRFPGGQLRPDAPR